MENEIRILGLATLGNFIKTYYNKNESNFNEEEIAFSDVLIKSKIENPWFTETSLETALLQWAQILNEVNIKNWLQNYQFQNSEKKVGLILAGNIPIVGFHDIACVILSGNIPMIKLSSKDRLIIPFLLKKWREFSNDSFNYHFLEKLEDFDAVIATGSNNTARYLEYYFKNHLHIIRKSRTSIAVLDGEETLEDLQLLAKDIFTYFGLGCRNVTKILVPESYDIQLLFESFVAHQDIVNHHKYANNYDYYKAIYLLNQDLFWDNNFVMLKEDRQIFSPLSVINFSRYKNREEVQGFLAENKENIQCIVASARLSLESISFGEAQNPSLETYADHVDTMAFLSVL